MLDWIIKKKLGQGIAKFEKRIFGKKVDLVFEKTEQIWIIEAKKQLDHKSVGQVNSYGDLYLHQIRPSKDILRGIVYEKGDLAIEKVCKHQKINLFQYKGKRVETNLGLPICNICGNQMIKGVCRTCEYYFGASSITKECSRCKREFGSLPGIVEQVRQVIDYERVIPADSRELFKAWWSDDVCPNCKEEMEDKWFQKITFNGKPYPENKKYAVGGTLNLLIKKASQEGLVTPLQLAYVLQMPLENVKRYIRYCKGLEKPYFIENK
jgi:hypothetical protein